jgi:hypothetical protein
LSVATRGDLPEPTFVPLLQRMWRDGIAWLTSPAGRPLLVGAIVLTIGQLIVAAFEVDVLHLPMVREEPPTFTLFGLGVSAFAVCVAGLLVAALVRGRAWSCAYDREGATRLELGIGLASLAAALAGTALFLASPAAFHAVAQEDRPLEWSTALLLLAASSLLGLHAARHRRAPLVALCAALLCVALFLVGMEEISWGQRLFGFATPEGLAEMNWQHEFNFHNVQTDLSETVYYFGAGVFLLGLPLLRDILPDSWLAHPLLALAPRRSVALVSAPIAIFNYGHWDLLPIKLTIALGFWAMVAWTFTARRRGHAGEGLVLAAAAAAVLVGQGLFLAFGYTQSDVPDASEYKELFIALGFAWYAAQTAMSALARARS